MLPALAWIIAAYVFFRLIERTIMCVGNKDINDTSRGLIFVLAIIAMIVVGFNLYSITTAEERAAQAARDAWVGSSDGAPHTSSSTGSTSGQTSGTEPERTQSYDSSPNTNSSTYTIEQCQECNGKGYCAKCGGRGCDDCQSTGKCWMCGGTGKIENTSGSR